MPSAKAAFAGTNEQFIANLAHQLRYPLVPIRNAAALLKQEAPDAVTIHRVADIIERQTNSMQRLIGDLVDVSRLEMGALPLHRTHASLMGLIDHAVGFCEALANERGHTLSVSVASTPVQLLVDLPRLSQALRHIIENACRYANPHGHICIRAQQDGPCAVITVSDTGDGIAATESEKIFALFERSEHVRRAEQGLGIGLYLARHFIEAHGGTVNVASRGLGCGSVFTAKIPCEAANAPRLEDASAVTAIGPSRA